MMLIKFLNNTYYFAFIMLLLLFACSKSEQKQETVQKQNSIFEDFPSPIQNFSIGNAKDTTITGENGTKVFIPKDAFNTDGKENIQLTLIEYYQKKDMLMEGLTTMTRDGKLLISGGMVYLSANKGDTVLEINSGKEISIYFNEDYNKENLPMKPFIGYPDSREPGSGGVLTWVLEEETIRREDENQFDTLTFDSGEQLILRATELNNYIFKTTKLNWINADVFYEYNDTSKVVVEVNENANAMVRMVFLDKKSIMWGKEINNSQYNFKVVPVGERVALLAFSKIGDQYFLASKRITIKEDHPVEKLNLKEVSLEEIKEVLKKLD